MYHQLKQLRQYHSGPVDYVWDRLSSDGFYDEERFRFQGEMLWRAYELLYPRDKRMISREVLNTTGLKGAAALWMDQGRVTGKKGSIRGRYSEKEYEALESWFNDLSIPAKIHRNNISIVQLSFKKDALQDLFSLIKPLIHVTMKKKLKQELSKFR